MRILNGLKFLNGLKLVFALAITLAAISGTVSAQVTVVIDNNQPIPNSEISSIVLLRSGQLNIITTPPGYTITRNVVPGAVSITDFGATPATILEGGNTNLNWTTVNATSCTASGGAGGWDGLSIGVQSAGTSITIPTAGSYTFTLTCADTAGGSAVRNTLVTVTVPGAVSITDFRATPATILEGGNTNLSWTTVNATSCTASGGAGGWDGLSIGVQSAGTSITIPTAGSYTFTLTCADAAGGSDVSNTLVTVNAQGTCSTALAGSTQTWLDFWGIDFPFPSFAMKQIIIPRFEYLAIEFDTGDVPDGGQLLTLVSTQNLGVRTGAISTCPGVFEVEPLCSQTWGTGGAINLSTNGQLNTCQLELGERYYFNITFTDGIDPTASTCLNTQCVTNLQYMKNR